MLLSLFSVTVIAEEASIQDQIIDIKNRIEALEKSNVQLREEITSKDDEVARLKQQLQALEEQIRDN
jgi:predicted nuclease with TOPRIM domain